MIRTASRAALLTVALWLVACTTAVMQPVTPIPVDGGRTARLVSAYRAENRLGPMHVDARLMRAAASYASVLGSRDKLGHNVGGTLPRRVNATGYDWSFVAENLAAGYPGLDDAMRGWKASAGHRRNLLSPLATEIGIAAVATPAGSRHRNYWVLILATPQPKRIVTASPMIALRRLR